MAENFNQSIIRLGNEINDLSSRIRDIRSREIGNLFSSDEYKKALKAINAINDYDRAVAVRDRSRLIIEAKREMGRDPERWSSPSEYMRWKALREEGRRYTQSKESAFAAYRVATGHMPRYFPTELLGRIQKYGRAGGQAAFRWDAESILKSIESPEEYRLDQEGRQWGPLWSDRFERARRGKLHERGEQTAIATQARHGFAFRRDYGWNDRQRKLFEYAQTYGAANAVAAMEADDLKERKENRYRYLRKQVKERRALYDNAPWMKTLVKAGFVEQKYIPDISKKIDKMVRLPIAGAGIAMAMKHPALAAFATIGAYLSKSVASDLSVSSMGTGLKAFGDVPEEFRKAAGSAGMSEAQIQKSWYGLVGKYGIGALGLLTSISRSMHGKTQAERIMTAQALGLDEALVRTADILRSPQAVSASERVSRAKGLIEKKKEFGYSSEGDLLDFLTSAYLTIPFMTSAAAKDAAQSKWVMEGLLRDEERMNEILSKVPEAQNAAMSAAKYDAGEVKGAASVVNSGGNTVSLNINHAEFNNANPREFMRGLIEISSERSGIDVMEAFDRREIA